jgi:hypothetical protein
VAVNRQPHDPGAMAQARQLYLQRGPAEASRLTGVPPRTLRRWAERGHWRPRNQESGHSPELGVAPVAPRSAGTSGHAAKETVAARPLWNPHRVLGRILVELGAELDDLAAARAEGKRREARDTAVVVGILVDKAQALAERAGADRPTDPADAAEHIRQVLDAIQARVEAQGRADA